MGLNDEPGLIFLYWNTQREKETLSIKDQNLFYLFPCNKKCLWINKNDHQLVLLASKKLI